MQNNSVVEIHAQAPEIVQIESLAKIKMKSIDELKEKIKNKKDELESALLADSQYEQLTKNAEELKEARKKAKERVMNNPAVYKKSQELDEMKQELKESKETLNSYVSEYYQKTGQLTIEDYMGELRRIEMLPKLVKEQKPFNPRKS